MQTRNTVTTKTENIKKGVGSLWLYKDDDVYILAITGPQDVILISLGGGHRYTEKAIPITTFDNISKEEWDKITAGAAFTRVYDVRIEDNKGGKE